MTADDRVSLIAQLIATMRQSLADGSLTPAEGHEEAMSLFERRRPKLTPNEQVFILAQVFNPPPPTAPSGGTNASGSTFGDQATVAGGAVSQGNAAIHGGTVHGGVVGTNLGTIIYGADLNAQRGEQLEQYLSSVVGAMERLPLYGMGGKLDTRQGISLPEVYVLLATEHHVEVARGDHDHLAAFFDDKTLKRDYDPAFVLPHQAIVEITPFGAESSQRMLLRAELASEAVLQRQKLVLLGDPGSGKSTFVHHLAWALAQRGLDQFDARSALFGWNDQLRLLPVVLSLRTLAGLLATEGAKIATVSAALRAELSDAYDVREADTLLQQALRTGNALVLFDGLDEVPAIALPTVADRLTTLRLVHDFATRYPKARWVVTCRTRAFDATLRATLDWDVATLAPFTGGQIRQFTATWYAELVEKNQLSRDHARRQETVLITTVLTPHRTNLRTMAGNPLLLTMMALVLYEQGELPRDRPTLYENILTQLLGQWDKQREGQNLSQVIGDARIGSSELRPLLDQLCYEAHRDATSADGRGRIDRATLERTLSRYFRTVQVAGALEAAERCIEYFDQRSGLLIPEDDGAVYALAHLTLQEHSAGRYLLLHARAAQLVMEHRADDRWREPIFLGIGFLHKHVQPLADRIETILRKLVDRDEQGSTKPVARWYRDVLLAAEIGAERDWSLLRPLIDVASIQRDIRAGLRALLADAAQPLPTAERVRAGTVLGVLPASVGHPTCIPEWVEVAAGTFLRGSDPTQDRAAGKDEVPQHAVTLPDYRIAKYPTTNAQYAHFITAGGYTDARWWTWSDAAQAWWQGNTRREPVYWDDERFNNPLQPVVGVSWYEAVAYTHWLEAELVAQGLITAETAVRLPSEAEWEYAARGADGRLYPWGNAWRPDHANTAETGVGVPTPVGCFPAGASPWGALDMAGNVREWCATVYGAYDATASVEPVDWAGRQGRVLRGGSYYENSTNVRCAARYRNPPDYGFSYGNQGFRCSVAPRFARLC